MRQAAPLVGRKPLLSIDLDQLTEIKAEPERIPDRVKAAIAEEQRRSEVLVGWVQIGIVVLFATLYFTARKTFDDSAPFAPVPIALAAYFAFTVVRLWLARRGHLPAWFLVLSTIVDMSALMVLIWSFHLQYQQPPAFYLKAPTLLYVFILIALRALRFEARYVVLGGGVAVLGWFALVLYAVLAAPQPEPITRDYVHYMMSFTVLIGAEVDKLISITVVTVILALVMIRGRRLLTRAVRESTANRDLRRFFAPEVVTKITEADSELRPGIAETRDAAIMFVDLRGFTSLTRTMTPAAALTMLGEYQSRLVPVIHRHDGRVDKFLGDGILVSFGALSTSPTYAADCLEAAGAVLAEASAWAAERATCGLPAPAVGLGLASGPVMSGTIGDADRLEYTVIGDPVNLAAKLEKHTKELSVSALVSETLYQQALVQGYQPAYPARGVVSSTVAGLDEPIQLRVLA